MLVKESTQFPVLLTPRKPPGRASRVDDKQLGTLKKQHHS